MEKKKTQRESNKTVSKELLESYRKALYKVKSFFDSIEDLTMDDSALAESILKIGERIGKNIETLIVLEKKVEAEEMEKTKITGNKKISLLENDEI